MFHLVKIKCFINIEVGLRFQRADSIFETMNMKSLYGVLTKYHLYPIIEI